MIQVALNGVRTSAENPAIPMTASEMADSAREAVAAGAGCVHFHVRGEDGRETLNPIDVAAALKIMRAAVSGTPVGISTAEWILPDSIERQRVVSQWTVFPNFISVNFNEIGAEALAAFFIAHGVGIEAGVGTVRTAEMFIGSKLASDCLRVMIEPEEQNIEEALKVVDYVSAFLDRAAIKIPRLMHGYEKTVWPFVDAAAHRGYDTRVGFEESLHLPDGSPAASNAALVAEAVRRTTALHATTKTTSAKSHTPS